MRLPLIRRTLARAPTALAMACLAASSLAAQSPLSLTEAQRSAVERSRQTAALGYAVAASREMAVAAGQLPDPVLKLGVENLPADGPDRFSFGRDFMTMRRIGVMQELTGSDKRKLRAQRFELEALKGAAEREMAVATVQRDVTLAWLDVYYMESMAAVIAEQRLRGLQEVEGSEAAYRAGRGSQADVFMTRGALAMLDDRAAELKRRVRNARTMLARWTGGGGDRPLGDKPDIGAIHYAHVQEEGLAQHPEIEALSRQEEIATTEARLARANRYPDWSVELAYSVRGPAFGNMVSFGVSVPLPWDAPDRQDREAAAKLASAAQAGALRDEALRQHVAEVRAMVQEWESDRERSVRYEREIVPLAAGRAEAALAAYRGGKSSVNDVLAARRGELEARLQALQLEADTARLWAQLSFLIPKDPK